MLSKVIYLLILLNLLNACKKEYKNTILIPLKSNSYTYPVSNGMKIRIDSNTFSKQERVFMKLIPIESEKDVIENQLTTDDLDGKRLLSAGMIYVSFQDQNGKALEPLKNYTIYSDDKDTDSVQGFQAFRGKRINNYVKWEKLPQPKKIDFYDLIKSDFQGAIGPKTKQGLISDYLDSLFNEDSFKTILEGRIEFVSKNGVLKLKKIVWDSDPNYELETRIKNALDSVGTIFNSYPPGSKLEPIIPFRSIELFSEGNTQSIVTNKVGWFNFDRYVNSPITKVTVKNLDKRAKQLYLISNNYERVITSYYKGAGIVKFEFPIESGSEKFNCYVLDNNKNILFRRRISVEQEKETIVSAD